VKWNITEIVADVLQLVTSMQPLYILQGGYILYALRGTVSGTPQTVNKEQCAEAVVKSKTKG